MSFQFVVTLLNGYVVAKAPAKKLGAALVTAVLTAVTFTDTNILCVRAAQQASAAAWPLRLTRPRPRAPQLRRLRV